MEARKSKNQLPCPTAEELQTPEGIQTLIMTLIDAVARQRATATVKTVAIASLLPSLVALIRLRRAEDALNKGDFRSAGVWLSEPDGIVRGETWKS